LNELTLPPGSVTPEYGSYCTSGIPSSIMQHFGVKPVGMPLPHDALGETKGIENVVLLILDGFGMSAWRRQQSGGFVKTMATRGTVRPITTVFPSTTAAALTTFNTGLTPQEHGLHEWFLYIKNLDSVIATLPFSFARDYDERKANETLKGRMSPATLFSGRPIYGRLRESGVQVQCFVSRALAGTSYNSVAYASAEKVTFSSGPEMATLLRRAIESAGRPSFFNVYWSYIDATEHRYGPATDESELEASSLSFVLQKGLVERLGRKAAKRTLLIATADHGQVPISPEKTIYLNRYRTVVSYLRRLKSGLPIPANGSARDVFLHVQQGKEEEVMELLAKGLKGRASIVRVRDAIEHGLFGLNKPCRRFRERVGSLIILPHGNRTVWYKDTPDYELDLRGQHGGLSKEEMMVPLAVGRLSDLQR
jgi:hypothetical protein